MIHFTIHLLLAKKYLLFLSSIRDEFVVTSILLQKEHIQAA